MYVAGSAEETENAVPFQAKIGASSNQRLHSADPPGSMPSLKAFQSPSPNRPRLTFKLATTDRVVDPIRNWSDSTDDPVKAIV
ncbi:hypothetical protein AJ87_43305 [Rhizobium yanglingense]|nr:hypothetical protein AJ87_43305 [Rhizobium yanglingense]